MKLSLRTKKSQAMYSIIVGGLLFFSVMHDVHAQPFEVACDMIADQLRVNSALAVCGDALICGSLTVQGAFGTRGVGILNCSANDIGFTTCQQTNLTYPNIWVQNAYSGCVANTQFSEIRGVPLYTADYAADLSVLSIPTLPYLDFVLPSDFDSSGGGNFEVDLHFFTQCRDPLATGPQDVINSGPICGTQAVGTQVGITMIGDFILAGGTIGDASVVCGDIQVSTVQLGVLAPANRTTFIHYRVTFCFTGAQVAANMAAGDWARLMWYRTSTTSEEYEYTVFIGPVEVRYPKIALACPPVTTCPVVP